MNIKVNNNSGTVDFFDKEFCFQVGFHRTIRLPEDGKQHALPPSLGTFPVHRIDDYKEKVPNDWLVHGGIFIPLHQREALWLSFHGSKSAVKIAAGKINAVSGKPWNSILHKPDDGTMDYMVAPNPQLWLDGFNAGDGSIKQFVGMALGQGYTVEGQVTGEEKFGGIQLLIVPPTLEARRRFAEEQKYAEGVQGSQGPQGDLGVCGQSVNCCFSSHSSRSRSMKRSIKGAQIGLAAGGKITQKIYPDPHGIESWDLSKAGRLFVHIINAEMYKEIVGEYPPEMPMSAQEYSGPYFDLNDDQMETTTSTDVFTDVKTVSEMDSKHGFEGQQDDSSTEEKDVITYNVYENDDKVRDGNW